MFVPKLQCDQIGIFFKALGDIFCKNSPKSWQFWAFYEKLCGYVLGTFGWKLGYFYSGHTVIAFTQIFDIN